MVNIDDLELDDGIKEVVTLLQENGIDTFSSCEGGDGHAFDMPTVRINFDADVEKIASVLIEHGYSGFYISKHWAYGSDVVRSNDLINFIQVEFWVSLKSDEVCLNCGRPLVNGVCSPCFAPQISDFETIENHEIEVVIRDTNNNILKIDKVPARAARATIYVQTEPITVTHQTGMNWDFMPYNPNLGKTTSG